MRATDLLPPTLSQHRAARRRRAHAREPDAPSPHCTADLAVERVRSAGGPVDNACYSCSCGLVFAAAVSTTVACPHCGSDQAW